MFGNDLPHVTSLGASAAIVLVSVSPAPAGTPQGFGVTKHHGWVIKYLPNSLWLLGAQQTEGGEGSWPASTSVSCFGKAGGGACSRRGTRSGPYILWFVSLVLRGTRTWVRWWRCVSPNVFEIAWCACAWARAWNCVWNNASFLCFCTSLLVGHSIEQFCSPLRLWSETFQWRLWSSCRSSLELCIEQFLHLNILACYWFPEVSVWLDLVCYRAEMINPKTLGSCCFLFHEQDNFSS